MSTVDYELLGTSATAAETAPGLIGSQFFRFLYKKAHFSSNWTSRVEGGKRQQLIVGGLGVPIGEQGQPRDRVFFDPNQPGGLADATTLGHGQQPLRPAADF